MRKNKQVRYGKAPEYHKLKVMRTSNEVMGRMLDGLTVVAEYKVETLNSGCVMAMIAKAPDKSYIGVVAKEGESRVAYMEAKNPGSFLRLFTHFSKLGELTYGIYSSLFRRMEECKTVQRD